MSLLKPLASLSPILMNAMFLRRSLVVVLCIVTIGLFHKTTNAAAKDDRPNLLFILADDMGYGDVQALNPESKIPTPHLDGLAAAGMTFTDAHTPSAVCTPTRYGVVTGRYCWRTRLKSGVLNGYGEPLIEDDRTTVAEFLKEQGYRTGIVGKWHLGLGFAKKGKEFDFSQPVDNGPHTHGFDYSYIIPASLDFPPYVYIRDGELTEFPSIEQAAQKFPAFLRKGERSPDLTMENVLDDLAAQAGDFIAESTKGDKPFFLYLPLTAPHKPVIPHPRYQEKTSLGPYADFVAQVDATVGAVLESLEEAGAAENTLVIYTSDNGSFMYRLGDDAKDHTDDISVQGYRAEKHTANAIYRGTKADVWEAGHRVPFLVRWPKKIEAGSQCAKTVCLTDFFATAADIIAAEIPEGTAPDSFSLLSLFQGQGWQEQRPPVIHHSVAGMFAIRDGKWKLVLGNGSGGREKPRGKPFEKPYALFDMEQDPEEQHNVIDQHPQVAKRLEEKCLQIRDSGTSRGK